MLWGIDLGGTKIEAAILDPAADNRVVVRKRLPTEQEDGYQHIIAQIARAVEEVEAESALARPHTIGIGTPGAIDPRTGLLKNSNTACLIGRPLREDLEAALGAKLKMANDANCFALAEATLGAARGYETVFGVIMGTGVGGGIVANGQVLDGLHGIAGEWGHNVLDPTGPACYCGKRGCVETFISGPALERLYSELSGRKLPLVQVVQQVPLGDPHAVATLDHLCERFGQAIAYVINTLDPHAIVLGGGVGNVERLYTDGAAAARRHAFNEGRLDTPFLRPQLGDSAGVFGAALLTQGP